MTASLGEIKLARLRELRDIKIAALRAGTAAARDLTASWRSVARPDQTLPDGDWRVMLWLGGRGSGKTRAGSQALAELILADTEPGEWGIVGPTYRDAWTTCIEGESGLLAAVGTTMADAVAGNSQIIASVVRGTGEIRFRNGSIVRADSADDGALRIQGKNLRGVWCDELGLVARWEIAWDESIAFAVRKGSSRIIATGTPKVSRPAAKLIRRLVKESEDPGAGIVVRHLKTRDNLANLSETFYRSVVARSKGTRLERQELEGELLDDTDGALWTWDVIDRSRVEPDAVPELVRVVVAVDPAVTSGQEADETGIVVMGEGKDGHGYVLADMSMRAAPDVCMRRASAAYHDWQADRVVAEVNNGGDYIGTLLHAVDPVIPYRKVTATRGKLTRAEPLSALYAQGKIHHAGVFPDLEDQMVTWVPGGDDSPDRLDALVWCAADLRGLLAGSWLEAYGMIKCQGCGRTFSDKQHKCPECAAPVTAAA
jgi:phage terminase large subunit-like protein